MVFDKDSGVDIVHAVAASCAVPLVWPAVTIDGKHYVDGGMRSTANVDLAARCRRRRGDRAAAAGVQQGHLDPRPAGAHGRDPHRRRHPDEQALADIGKNVLDPAKRADAARAGLRQAAAVLDKVRPAWQDAREVG